ncbi:MAG TPA: dihydrodipicolinate synthase family protein [Nocardioidaceae bacterium]|nr:dihydrodipicolinate synthase family protein [Nocardioidaceae bacterium]
MTSEAADPVFTGAGVALATLFDEDLAVDYAASARHARRLVDAGIRAVVVCGTSGEPETLGDEERLALLDAVLDAVGGDAPVVMGASLASGWQSAQFAAEVVEREVGAVLARSPRGVQDPLGFYRSVAAVVGDTPLFAYHFPAVAPPGIPVERLADLPVRGLKDSSGDPGRLLATLDAFAGDLYVGAAPLLLMAGELECAGAILQLANACPELCLGAFGGDAKAQRALTASHLRATSRFPLGIKSLMRERFGTSEATRLGS